MIRIDGYEIDVAMSEDHSFDNEVTSHPVELGADITDHVRAQPIRVSLEGIVSNTPIGSLAQRRNEFEVIDGEAFALPSEEAYARLVQIRNKKEPVIIETTIGTFHNMMLESLGIPTSAETGDALRFTVTFIQIQLVTNQRATVKVSVPRAARKRNLGNKPSATVPLKVGDKVTIDGKEGTVVSVFPGDPSQSPSAQGRVPIASGGGKFTSPPNRTNSAVRKLVAAGGGP